MRFLILSFFTAEAGLAQPIADEREPLQALTPRIVRDCAREARRALERGDEIVVCAEARSPYRLPPSERFDLAGPVDSVSRERHRLYEHGESGTGSCSTVGPGGWTGCMSKRWKEAREQWGR